MAPSPTQTKESARLIPFGGGCGAVIRYDGRIVRQGVRAKIVCGMPSDAIEGKRTGSDARAASTRAKLQRLPIREGVVGRNYTFFDACAGIGCFHLGMDKAGFDCVGAAEIDAGLQERYLKAFGLEPRGRCSAMSEDHRGRGMGHAQGGDAGGHGRGRLPMHAMVEVRQPDREGPRRGHGLLGRWT